MSVSWISLGNVISLGEGGTTINEIEVVHPLNATIVVKATLVGELID